MVNVRSPGLVALALALIAAASALGYLLVHDGEVEVPVLALANPGDEVTMKGGFAEFDAPTKDAWFEVRSLLLEHTYFYDGGDPTMVVLATSDVAVPEGEIVLAQGQVTHLGVHPDDPERILILVAVHDWTLPLVFR